MRFGRGFVIGIEGDTLPVVTATEGSDVTGLVSPLLHGFATRIPVFCRGSTLTTELAMAGPSGRGNGR